MVVKIRDLCTRARVLTAAAVVGGAMLMPVAANAATVSAFLLNRSSDLTDDGSSVTLTGVIEEFPNPYCYTLRTEDGSTYDLYKPDDLTRDQAKLMISGFPLGVPVEVQATELTGLASYCMTGPMMSVQWFTVLG